MLKHIQRTLDGLATPRTTYGLVAVALLIMGYVNLFDLPMTLPRLRQETGGFGILDSQGFYTASQAYGILAGLGTYGRHVYRIVLLTVDVILPLSYGLGFSLLLTRMLKRLVRPESLLRRLSLLPLAGMVLDYAENVAILTLLFAYPHRLNGVATVAGFLTLSKTGVLDFSLLVILVAGFGLAVKRFRKQA